MSAMTLEQIARWHRDQAWGCGLHEHLQGEGQKHDEMADAIDAHAQMVEKVREIIDTLRDYDDHGLADKLAAAIGDKP